MQYISICMQYSLLSQISFIFENHSLKYRKNVFPGNFFSLTMIVIIIIIEHLFAVDKKKFHKKS